MSKVEEKILVNRKAVRNNKELKISQKKSKKYYGRVKGKKKLAPHGKIGKLADVENVECIRGNVGQDLIENKPNIENVEEFIQLLLDLEVTGGSGNGFLVGIKLKEFAKYIGKGRIIINAVECDPGLIHDGWIYQHQAEQLNEGIACLHRFFKPIEIIIATREPENKAINGAVYQKVPNKYPMGYENFLVRYIYEEEIREKETPIDYGILVINIQTILFLAKVMQGTYKNEHYITVANLSEGVGKVVKVAKGEKVVDILRMVYKDNLSLQKYTGGGALRSHVVTEDEVITNTTSYIAYGKAAIFTNDERCKGCGGCSRNCPMGIRLKAFILDKEKGRQQSAKEYGLQNCIHCGMCSYVCHAGKNIMEIVGKES